jgi:predicted ATPase
MIDHLHIENFRSVKLLDISLPPISFFCGPNASGKTNFSEALDFLSLTFEKGLAFAIAEKGGFYNMCFRRERRSRGAIRFDVSGKVSRKEVLLTIAIHFSIQTRGQAIRSDFYVESESYTFNLESSEGKGFVRIFKKDEKYLCTASDSFPSDISALYPMVRAAAGFFANNHIEADDRTLLYPSPYESFFPFSREIRALASARVFRINPRTARQSGAPSVLGELGKFGDNLPSALDNLAINHAPIFKRLEELLKEVVPGLTSLRTRYTASRQMGLFLQEEGFGNPWDAEELSDGTLMSMALFVALLQPSYRCVMIEEPENSLHPWILRKFLQLCEEVSETKQVMLTTQSPLVVAIAEPGNLFLVERKEGMTEIVPALEREKILPEMLKRQFLDLGQYWLSGGLGAVPVALDEQVSLFEDPEDPKE